ncbi:MAG: F0F1 ATP synthase subunit alpha [Chloroflexi bacterium]|nr:F0F1 ATP synthase subunit alpha [Chloroflexota bacterium]
MAARSSAEISSILRQQIENFDQVVETTNVGTVIDIGDGIAHIWGLSDAQAMELLEFPNQVMGLAFNLEEDTVGAMIFGDGSLIAEGDEVRCTGRVMEVPVGDGLLGRVIDALGRPLDGKGPIVSDKTRPIEKIAHGVIYRQPVTTPVQTGIKALDSMIPIGRGQRELIIGDRQTGKTAIAIDTIINQKGGNLFCIYVAIGQKASQVANIVETLDRAGALAYTVVVAATAADPAPMQYIAPYAGCAIGEEIMESGRDALVVYDDLTKHAWAYRQVSLLLRRPAGREAYPGDVFYCHSRLLERAARLRDDQGGGSLTALPIIETQGNDVSGYIPTNVISITDGQIYLESDLFYAGIRPALNVGISVSRVGGAAQTRAMRQVAGRLKLDLAQFRELAAFSQIGSDLDRATRAQLERGMRIQEVLKQPQYHPVPLAQQVLTLWAVTNGYLDEVPIDKARAWEDAFQGYMERSHPQVAQAIATDKQISDSTLEALRAAAEQFKNEGARAIA